MDHETGENKYDELTCDLLGWSRWNE